VRAPLMILTDDGQQVHDTINRHSRERNLHQRPRSARKGSPSYADCSVATETP
jgi:hypothetical protein